MEQIYTVIGLLVVVMVGLVSRAVQAGSVTVSGPALVLKHFSITPTSQNGNIVTMVGRPEGIISWLLTVFGIAADTTFVLSRQYVIKISSSLSGEHREAAPVKAVASTHGGYSSSIGLLFLAVMVLVTGTCLSLILHSVVPFLLGVLFVGLLLVSYTQSKKLMIAVETNGGKIIGIKFRKGIIEGVPVDIKGVGSVIDLLHQLMVAR
jgi:hypothetical protein